MAVKLDPFHASLLFRSLKLHYTTKYNYFERNGKVRGDSLASKQKFLQNKTKYYYGLLAKHEEPFQLVVSNLIFDPTLFIVDIVNDKGYN